MHDPMTKAQAAKLTEMLAAAGLNKKQQAAVRARVGKLGAIDWEKFMAFVKWIIELIKTFIK